MIANSMLIVGVLLLLIWVVLFSRWRWINKAVILIPALGLIGGFIASVRSVDMSGDVGLTFEYKWQPTQEERIAAHKAKLGAAAPNANPESPTTETSDPVLVGTNYSPSIDTSRHSPATPEDSPAYRGANRDGIVIGPPIRTAWDSAPKPLWEQPVGGGYASMAIVADLLVTIEQRDNNEVVLCYQASTGRELWKYEHPARFFQGMDGPGPRSTPTIDGALVFAQGTDGEVMCLELATGHLKWSKNLLKMYHLPNNQWGMTCSPLVMGSHVIVNAGGRYGDGLVAFNRTLGDVVWAGAGLIASGETPVGDAKPDAAPTPPPATDKDGHPVVPESGQNRPGYSSPTLVTIHGVQQLLNFDGTGLRGVDPETGKTLWFEKHENGPSVNVAQPIVFDDGRIFISCSYDVGCAMVQVSHAGDAWSTKKLWENLNLRCKFTSPILVDGYLYGLDEGILVCLDPQTGDRKWKKGRYNHGQIMLTNGILVVITENGRCVFVKPNPEKLEELSEFPALSSDYKTWNPPALVRGKLYVRNHHDMACYDLVK